MNLQKKIQCIHCKGVIECQHGVCNVSCKCGKVKTNGTIIVEGTIGLDYMDVSPKLLQE